MTTQQGRKTKAVHVHLVSDSTGETVATVARACLVQFDNIGPVKENPGVVIYTMVDRDIQDGLEEGCRHLQVPCVSVLDPVLEALHSYVGAKARATPGRQHEMDAENFARIEAIHFVLAHDDGQSPGDFREADVILAGVSRTLKTPTCIYLANRGIKAANIPILPGVAVPPEVLEDGAPLVIGLTKDPKRLVQIRRSRLRLLDRDENTDYADIATVSEEIRLAREIFARHKWPFIDVSERSVEEVAAIIMQLCKERQERQP